MDLTSLNFKVETKDLDTAIGKLKEMQASLDGLAAPMQNLAKNSGKVNKEVTESEKATKRNVKAQEDANESTSKAASILEKQTRTLSIFRNETQKAADGTVKLGDSFTKSQAGMLAIMQLAGSTATQLQQLSKVFIDYNKIVGLDTFDKSAQALSKLKKEMKETNQVAALQAQGISLTKDEYVGLARDLERAKQAMRAEGATAKETANAMRSLKQEFITLATARNQQMAGVAAAERQAKSTASRMQNELTMMDQAVVKFRESELTKARETQRRLDAEATAMNQAVALFNANEQKKAAATQRTTDAINLQIQRAELAQKYINEGFTIGQANRGARLESGGANDGMVRQILQQDQANREAARSTRDFANAVQFLADEEQRADAVLAQVTGQTNRQMQASERTTDKVIAYGRALQRAGTDAQTAAAKMDIYKKKLLEIEKVETQRRSEFLSRALAPQISDVVVSLGSGQNPLTVMLQQGLQVRDLIGQSGVAVEDLQRTFKTAASDMVSSLKGTAAALGSLLIGTINDAGKATFDFVTGPFKLLAESYTQLGTYLRTGAKDTNALDAAFQAWGKSATSMLSMLRLGVVGFAAALAIAGYQVMKEQTEMSKALTLTGAGLGLSKDEAVEFAKSMKEVGVSTSSSVKFLTALGKESAFIEGDLQKITKSASALSKVAGVSMEDTAKRLEDLGSKPVESLIKYARESGRVELAVLQQVVALQKAGDATAAAKLAQDTWAEGAAQQATEIYDNLSPLEKVWMDIRSQIKGAWEEMKEFARSETLAKTFAVVWQTIAVIASEVWFAIRGTGREIGGIAAQLGAILTGDFAAAKAIRQEMLNDSQQAAVEQKNLVARIMATGQATKEYNTENKKTSEELKKNAQAAAAFSRQLRESKKEQEAVDKELARLRKSEMRDKERINDLNGEAARVTENYSKAQKLALDIFSNEDFAKYSETTRIQIANALELAHANEMVAVALQKRREADRKVYEQYIENQANSDKAAFDLLQKLDEQNQSVIDESNSLELLAATLGKTSEERQKSIELRKIEIELAKELAKISNTDFTNDTEGRAIAVARAYENAEIAARNVNRRIAIDAAIQMQTSLSDAIETALFEGGKAGSKKLRDIIVAELRKPIRVFIEAVVGKITGSMFGGSGGSSSGAGSSSFSVSDIVSTLKSGFSALNGTVSNTVGTYFSQFAGSSMGQSLGLSNTGYMAGNMGPVAPGGQLTSLGSSMGTALGMAGNAVAGYGIGKTISTGISNGYSVGKGYNKFQDVGMAIGSAIGGPLVGAAIGAVTGVVNRAFGRKAPVTTASGIEGTFGTTGANVNQFTETFQKGGWFRSNKRRRTTSAVSSELDTFLDESLTQITSTTKAFASVLGLVPSSIDGVTQGINISLMGLDAEGQQKAIANALGGFGDILAKTLLGSSDFKLEGETASQTLARLATSLTVVNSTFDTLNQELLKASLIGGNAASKLLEAFGGVESFANLTADYYQNFYSEQERLGTTTRQLTTIFGDMGLTLPKTREEFRALVESQDLYTDAGRSTYAALLNLAPTFATITSAVEEFTASLIDEVRRLRGEIAGSSAGGGLDFFREQFSAANTAALAGDRTALEQLPELSRMVEEAAKTQANSSADIIRIQAWLAQSLSNTSGALGQQVPQFANGGLHTGGARIVGERGPELEITGPSRIMNASQTAGILNGSTAEMLKVLNDNITGLRSEVRADVTHNAKVAKLLDRVIPDGDAIQISGTIDGGTV